MKTLLPFLLSFSALAQAPALQDARVHTNMIPVVQSSTTNIALKTLGAAQAVAVVADLANIRGDTGQALAIVRDEIRGGTFLWLSSGTVDNIVTFAGSSGYWIRQFTGPVVAEWAGLTDWAVNINACVTAGHTNVLCEDGSGLASASITIPANTTLSLKQGSYLLTDETIYLTGDSATILGNGATVVSYQTASAAYSAILVEATAPATINTILIRDLTLLGNNGTTTAGQKGYGIKLVRSIRGVIQNVNVDYFRESSGSVGTCVGLMMLADSNNCNRNIIGPFRVGNSDTAIRLRSEGGTYICGYNTFSSVLVDSQALDVVMDGDAAALAANLGPGYNTFSSVFVQNAGTTLTNVVFTGNNNYMFLTVDGGASAGYKSVWFTGTCQGNTVHGRGSVTANVADATTSGSGNLVLGGSSALPATFGNATYTVQPATTGSGKDMIFAVTPAGTNVHSVIQLLPKGTSGATVGDWRIMGQGSSSAQHLILAQGASVYNASAGRARFFNGGGLSMIKLASDPTLTLPNDEATLYPKAGAGAIPQWYFRNSLGVWTVDSGLNRVSVTTQRTSLDDSTDIVAGDVGNMNTAGWPTVTGWTDNVGSWTYSGGASGSLSSSTVANLAVPGRTVTVTVTFTGTKTCNSGATLAFSVGGSVIKTFTTNPGASEVFSGQIGTSGGNITIAGTKNAGNLDVTLDAITVYVHADGDWLHRMAYNSSALTASTSAGPYVEVSASGTFAANGNTKVVTIGLSDQTASTVPVAIWSGTTTANAKDWILTGRLSASSPTAGNSKLAFRGKLEANGETVVIDTSYNADTVGSFAWNAAGYIFIGANADGADSDVTVNESSIELKP